MSNARAGLRGRIRSRAPGRRLRSRPGISLLPCLAGVFAILPALAGCGTGEESDPLSSSTTGAALRDSAGREVRVETGSGWAPGSGWRLEPAQRIGAVDGELAFGRVADVVPRAAGGMWLLDALAARVRGFDLKGVEALSFGSRGEGPGELRSPAGLVETDDGRLAVLESYPPRVSWFGPDGRWLSATRVAPGADATGTRTTVFAQWAVAPDGTAFAEVFGLPVPGVAETPHALLRYGPGDPTSAPDTVATWSVAGPIPDPDGGIPVLPPRPAWTVSPDGAVLWTPGSPYEIRTLAGATTSAGREPTRILRRPVAATRLTPGLRSTLEASIRRSLEAGGGGPAPGGVLERLRFPEALPHVAGLWVSRPDGTLYVARYTEASVREERPTSLDVFTSDGSFLGEMPLPDRFSPRSFTPEAAFGVVEDALGVPYAARYRIVRPPD